MSARGSFPSLHRLLYLAAPLHKGDSELSLRQLVPVHFSLLQAVLNGDNHQQDASEKLQSIDTSLDLDVLLQYREERRYILQLDTHPKEKLLVLQRLLFVFRHDALHGLAVVVMPYLLRENGWDDGAVDRHDDEELREAMLDAVFATHMGIVRGSQSTWLKECLRLCREPPTPADTGLCRDASLHWWLITCRVLTRLLKVGVAKSEVGSSSNDFLREIVAACYAKVQFGMDLANVDSDREVDQSKFMKPITAWILPLLCDQQQHIEDMSHSCELWKHIWKIYSSNDESDTKSLVVSAVLCGVLQSLSQRRLPVVGGLSSDLRIPLCHPILWDFVYSSLKQGKDASLVLRTGSAAKERLSSRDQTIRRRGLYLLRIVVESTEIGSSNLWSKFLLCLEALEMETEPHLVDQVWDSVSELCIAASSATSDVVSKQELPVISWSWISVLLASAFFSETPMLRKLALFRFLNGNLGVRVSNKDGHADESKRPSTLFRTGNKKHAIKAKRAVSSNLAPLTFMSPEFVVDVILPSFDSVAQSIGTHMKFEENGKIQSDDLEAKLNSFIASYSHAIELDAAATQKLMSGLWGFRTVCRLRTKLVVQIFRSVTDSLDERKNTICFTVSGDMLEEALDSIDLLFRTGSVVAVYREVLLECFVRLLARSSAEGAFDPKLILRVFSFFPVSHLSAKIPEVDTPAPLAEQNGSYHALRIWLATMGDSTTWASTVGAACASAFVTGQLLVRRDKWSPALGSTEAERTTGGAISLLCALAAQSELPMTAGDLLWPAIHKGLTNVPRGRPWVNADRATRGLILLENGCRLGSLSGMGNGALVVDRKNQRLLCPPPKIEAMLVEAVQFTLSHINALSSFDFTNDTANPPRGLRSGEAGRVSSSLARLIGQLATLSRAYPSSLAVSSAIDRMLVQSIHAIEQGNDIASNQVAKTAMVYAALSCGASPDLEDEAELVDKCSQLLTTCRLLLESEFTRNGFNRGSEQAARSVFYYAKWGALSCMMKHLRERNLTQPQDGNSGLSIFLSDLFDRALDSVRAAPTNALLPLFDCVVTGAKVWLPTATRDEAYAMNLDRIIAAVFGVVEDSSATGQEAIYMLDEVCALLFRPQLLLEEMLRLEEDRDSATPIRSAFRQLMKQAGAVRSHISKAVLCRLSIAWLGGPGVAEQEIGLGAIPYREDLVRLLLHKETKLEEENIRHYDAPRDDAAVVQLPEGTCDTSVVQGFVLLFLEKLPSEGLSPRVKTGLLHFLIDKLLEEASSAAPKKGSLMMSGTPLYSAKIRAWQALCVLSRFVTPDIAKKACGQAYYCLSQTLHGQIRYFMETFIIQCARAHPDMFGRALLVDLQRRDLSLQHVSSLMIIAGNLVTGRCKTEFFAEIERSGRTKMVLQEVLAGVLPWLSSTQGFTRGIAQLLVYELIPMVVHVDETVDSDIVDSDWFLRSTYLFLDKNPDTRRLRKKQSKFFDSYEIDEACTAEGILRMPVDEGNEANPEHMVEAIKKCLEQVYAEAHEHEVPIWKQVEDMMLAEEAQVSVEWNTENALVNFQRKIIPIDSLDLAMEESRLERLRNAAGQSKQRLIVCATLVDKVPNLAGLARTCEIFAACRLVIPDKNVCRMDAFKNISVGAERWIDIEECKEDALLSWLRLRKDEGYSIVGLEQTSSSSVITGFKFPEKCVLLLGKEKEGIPVQYLQTVDSCVEIPQLGILRSLNVHVTGALAVWEYTKQGLSLRSSES